MSNRVANQICEVHHLNSKQALEDGAAYKKGFILKMRLSELVFNDERINLKMQLSFIEMNMHIA